MQWANSLWGRFQCDVVSNPSFSLQRYREWQLAKELLQIEATGDRTRAENWFAKYGKMPVDLEKALATTKDVPVDIFPNFSFPMFKEGVR